MHLTLPLTSAKFDWITQGGLKRCEGKEETPTERKHTSSCTKGRIQKQVEIKKHRQGLAYTKAGGNEKAKTGFDLMGREFLDSRRAFEFPWIEIEFFVELFHDKMRI